MSATVTGPSGAELRKDIQVLRGIAVLQVILYHAAPAYLAGGYLGVDVFFVISGYLVTRMVLDRVDAGRFSFREFYARRARRLLPASSCTFLVCALLSPLLLTGPDRGPFLEQLLGAVTFSGNFVLWKASGYFVGNAALRPLLHVWSLSLEEQYYVVLPALLVVLGARWRIVGTGIACLASLALCFVAAAGHPLATFYLLPTRAWELLLGSLCAMLGGRLRMKPPRALLALSFMLILIVPAIQIDPVHPRLDALLVTAATAVLLLGRFGMLERAPGTSGLALVGDWSYSLYLVHWPLFAFAANAYAGGPRPGSVTLALVGLAFGLAYLQYRFVECRFRFARTSAARLVASVSAVCAIAVLVAWGSSLPAGATTSRDDPARARYGNSGMGAACNRSGRFTESPSCMTSAAPEVAVWGDSFAMQLVPGLLASGIGDTLVQMTHAGCGPALDFAIAPAAGTGNDLGWVADCLGFNASAHEYLRAKTSIRYVVMSSRFALDAPGARFYRPATGFTDPDEDVLLERYAATIQAVRAIGKKAVVVAPPPSLGPRGLNLGLCVERVASHRLLLGRTSCDFAERDYLAATASVVAFLGKLERAADVAILWPSHALCSAGVCRATIEGTRMYGTGAHLSDEGSVAFQRIFALDRKVLRDAR